MDSKFSRPDERDTAAYHEMCDIAWRTLLDRAAGLVVGNRRAAPPRRVSRTKWMRP
jgi:hypothetical protein